MRVTRSALVWNWIKSWASLLLILCGFYRIPVKGWRNVAEARAARAVVVFNHESYVDPVIVGALLAPAGVAKAGVARLPIIGSYARALQVRSAFPSLEDLRLAALFNAATCSRGFSLVFEGIKEARLLCTVLNFTVSCCLLLWLVQFLFIQRKGTHDQPNRYTLRSDPTEALAARAADERYPLIMIAPEATTKGRPCLLKFRKGAFAVGRPVLPMLIRYPCRHFYPGEPWSFGALFVLASVLKLTKTKS